MLQFMIRAAAASARSVNTSKVLIPAITRLSACEYASKASSGKGSKKKGGKKKDSKTQDPKNKYTKSKTDNVSTVDDYSEEGDLNLSETDIFIDENSRFNSLAKEINDKSLDVGPNGRPLFTTAWSLSDLTKNDACLYMLFNDEELKAKLPEGLPQGMVKEFEETRRSALLVRQGFLNIRNHFKKVVDPSLDLRGLEAPKLIKQIVLDGPVSCGKSIVLAMLVHWARDEGWLVFYVRSARDWTHGGFYYKNPKTGLWDTPLQAKAILQDFLKFNESHVKNLPCKISDPIPLGESAGEGLLKDIDTMAMPEGSTLYDLIQSGITYSHAAVGVVVRLRKELSLVTEIPVLIAVDQYNSWFTFSDYFEATTVRSARKIHSKEIAIINAFRPMKHEDMMIGAFSHSTAVGKLRKDLPGVPVNARVNVRRYSLNEAAAVSHYYLRQRLIRRETFSEENWKKVYYLANGNGAEMRFLAPFIRNGEAVKVSPDQPLSF